MVQKSDKSGKMPPPLEQADKVLKELQQKTEETQLSYNKYLKELQNLHNSKIEFISNEHLDYLREIRISSGIENLSLPAKIFNKIYNAFSVILPWIKKNRKRKYSTYKYLEALSESLAKYNQHQNNFRANLLNYAQQVAPLVNDKASEVSRQVTVLPVERMDILFVELMKEIDQLKTEVDRLKKINSQK